MSKFDMHCKANRAKPNKYRKNKLFIYHYNKKSKIVVTLAIPKLLIYVVSFNY